VFLPKSKQSTTFAYDWDGVDWIYYPLILFGPAFRVDEEGRRVIDRWLGWAAAIGATVMLTAIFGLPALPEAQQLTAAYVLLAVVIILFVWAYRRLYRFLRALRPDADLGPAWAQPADRLLLWKVILHLLISISALAVGADFAQASAAKDAWIPAAIGLVLAVGSGVYTMRFGRIIWRRIRG
jgi:hypothetical protein